jgi:uncharacterized protein (TIGR02246 family)
VKTTLLLLMLFVVTFSCLAQEAPSAYTDEGVTAIQTLVKHVRDSSETQDEHDYISVFSEHAIWDGPAGENAIGPDNIERAVKGMFARCGPLQTRKANFRPLAPDLEMVDMYQMAQLLPHDRNSIPAAPGSVGAPQGSNIRATLIVKNEAGRWRVIAARIADLRAINDQKTMAAK